MRLKENLGLKVLAFLLAVAAFVSAALMAWYQIANFDVIWEESTPAEGYSIGYLERQDYYDIKSLLSIYNVEAKGTELGVYDEQNKAELELRLSSDQTNLRWQARNRTGTIRYGNTQEEIPVPAEGFYLNSVSRPVDVPVTFTSETYTGDWKTAAEGAVNVTDPDNVVWFEDQTGWEDWSSWFQGTAAEYWNGNLDLSEEELDAVYLNSDGTADLLVVTDGQDRYVYGPTVRSYLTANEYGYQYEGGEWHQSEDPGILTETLDVTMWLEAGYPVADKYQRAYLTLSGWQSSRELVLAADIACAVAGLLLAAFLCAGAGHKRGVEGIYLHWFHRIPGDLLLAAIVLGVVLAVAFGLDLLYSIYYQQRSIVEQMLTAGALTVCVATPALAWLVTFAARCKARTLFKNTVIWRVCRLLWRLCRWCVRGIGSAAAALPLMWQVLVIGLAYLLFSALALSRVSGLWLLVTAVLIAYLCLWACQWKRIRRGAREIIGGHPEYHIDTRWLLPGLKDHADALNNLGQAISAAVDEQMKSERFKAELITNVSHDLKTPLTSIINYVDLLKKENVSSPKAREYIEVLDRKSQRLKKLTEDLVEASKASTGALTVTKERLDVTQLVRQAMGEYEEKLTAAGLTLVADLPEVPVYISADGRHLWRVLDNLLSNCAKYAQEGTRVYLDVAYGKENAVITLKNVSRQPLNVPAEQLMERFVRGDESRTTEGSGLGLSIARSLTELQDGRFSLAIDGDLFKAFVVFPLA